MQALAHPEPNTRTDASRQANGNSVRQQTPPGGRKRTPSPASRASSTEYVHSISLFLSPSHSTHHHLARSSRTRQPSNSRRPGSATRDTKASPARKVTTPTRTTTAAATAATTTAAAKPPTPKLSARFSFACHADSYSHLHLTRRQPSPARSTHTPQKSSASTTTTTAAAASAAAHPAATPSAFSTIPKV